MSRAALRAVTLGVSVGALLFGLFYAMNALSLRQPSAAMVDHVRAAYRQGDLDSDDYKRGDTRLGEHQFNDCLIVAMAIDHRAPKRDLRISPTHAFPRMNDGMCRNLRSVAKDGFGARPIVFYHNYIHGHVTLTRFLLTSLRLDQIRALYKAIGIALVGLGLIVGLWQLAKGRVQGAFWALMFFVFGRWFGLETFGQSLGHGPSDIVLLGYAVGLAFASARGGVGTRTLVVSAAAYGGATIIFELLTGGIPLGLALLVGGLPFACSDGVRIGRSVILSVFAYCSAIVTCCVIKMILVAHVFGWAAVMHIGNQGAQRIAGAPATETAIPLGVTVWVSSIWGQMTGLASGMAPLTLLVLETSVIAGIWGIATIRSRAGGTIGVHVACLALSNAPIVIWMAVFAQHTIVHAWFMDRMFAWTIVTGAAIFMIAVGRTHGARWSRGWPAPEIGIPAAHFE